jgi:hypothetical protein
MFAKPHISTCTEIIEKAQLLLSEYKIEVVSFRHAELDDRTFYLNYLPHSFFAAAPFANHIPYLCATGRERIESATGRHVSSLCSGGLLQGASEVMEKHGISPAELYRLWITSENLVRVQAGYQIKQIRISELGEMWVVNGYFPHRLDLYQDRRAAIPVWLLALPEGSLIQGMRQNLIGDNLSDHRSLRGFLSRNADRLQVSFDAFNNGFHMSDSDASCIRETAIWFPDWLGSHRIVSDILAPSHLSSEEASLILSGPEASFRLAEAASETELIETLVELLGKPS